MTARQLSQGDALATVALSIMLFLVLGPALASFGALGLAATQFVSFAVPALWISKSRTGDFASLGLRGFPPLALLGIGLLAGSVWIWNVHWVAPIGADWGRIEEAAELETLFALPTRPLWQSLVLFALVPAFCEELLHRGILLPALCRVLGRPAGLALSSLLFGLSHLSLARLLPTTILGLVSGGVRLWSGSLWPSMLLHAGYNACLLISASNDWAPPSSWAGIAAGASLIGGLLLHRAGQSLRNPDS